MEPIIITTDSIADIPKEIDLLSNLSNKYPCRVHIRKKNCKLDDLDVFCRRLSECVDGRTISLHGHIDLVEKYHFGGYHDSLQAIQSVSCRLGDRINYSTSCHSMDEADKMKLDYLFLSPIFDSISKQGYNSPYDLEELQEWLGNRTNNTKVVALGGIDKSNAAICYRMGFDGVALLGAIWNRGVSLENYDEIYKSINEIK